MRIALLMNCTGDLLAGMLKKNDDEIYLPAGFDTWQQEARLPSSGLYAFQPDAAVVLLYVDSYAEVWKNGKEDVLREWASSIRSIAEQGIPVLASTLDTMGCLCGASQGAQLESFWQTELETLRREGSPVYPLPVRESAANLGRKNFYSPKMWYSGSMPYSLKGLASLSGLIERYASALNGRKKKCLAVDLDNTLWGGVIGEDGVEGIVLSENKEGARYRDTQCCLKRMRERGVLLAVLSKNNPEDVDAAFTHPHMVLRREDFAAESVNWEPKSVNIRRLAKELNIGLDSFVFLDDNPAERERMKAECPEVTVLDFPKDSSLLPDVMADAWEEYFLSLLSTEEDGEKTAMYRAEARRKADRATAGSLADYLSGLEMRLDFHPMRQSEERRVVQLIHKTNQFNVTTKRYTEAEVHQLAESADWIILTARLSDRYGDQGLSAVIILKKEDDTAEIDSFLMSCRIMGRDVEKELTALLRELLEAEGIRTVRANYRRTAKNTPVENLFEELGFTVESRTEDEKKYRADVTDLPTRTGYFKERRT